MNTLDTEEQQGSQDFLDAFHYAQQGTGRRLQLGKLAFMYRDKKYRQSIKIAHSFIEFYVDKAIEYRQSRLAAKDSKLKGLLGENIVLLHEMAMETDNREDLRNQIMHGK